MSKVIANATDVRNNFFNFIDKVAKTGEPIFIKKNREVLVKLEPAYDEFDRDTAETKRLLNATRGIWANRAEKEITGRFKEANLTSTRRIRSRVW